MKLRNQDLLRQPNKLDDFEVNYWAIWDDPMTYKEGMESANV